MNDYVIVGAGSAGCVLAARLSEDRDVRVAVIEAGPPDSESVIHMPWTYLQLFESRISRLARHLDIARQPRGLRRVGGDGLRRLGV
jgi:choline dehydrogenase-like flavoprotein